MPLPDALQGDTSGPPAPETKTFSVERDGVIALDEWLEFLSRQWGLNPRTAFCARLCVAELANNVIEHGGNRRNDDTIVVTIRNEPARLVVEFMDTRAPFDPTGDAPGAEDLLDSIGGRGLMLIHKFAAELSYRHDGRYNRTVLNFPQA